MSSMSSWELKGNNREARKDREDFKEFLCALSGLCG